MPIQLSCYINTASGLILKDFSYVLAVFFFLSRYKNYEFVSDQEISKSAGLGSRYSDSSLHGVLFDIQMLSECDYLVCTFSSQVKHCFCCHGNRIYVVDTWMEHTCMPRVEPSFEHQRNLTTSSLSTSSQLKIPLGCEIFQGSNNSRHLIFSLATLMFCHTPLVCFSCIPLCNK